MATEVLAERESAPSLPMVTRDQIDLVKKTVASGATDDELRLFFYDCQRNGVHPLDRLIHFTKRGGKYTPITSIDLMRTRAHDTGECAGIDDAVFVSADETMRPTLATVTVYRLVGGQRCPFTATARWSEYYPGDQQGHMWRKMPRTMLGKCAEALALRKAFPKQLHGLYVREEMDQAERPEPMAKPEQPKRPRVVDPQTGEVAGPAPGMDAEAEERQVLLDAITKTATDLHLSTDERRALWKEHFGAAKPDQADIAKLGDVLQILRKRLTPVKDEEPPAQEESW